MEKLRLVTGATGGLGSALVRRLDGKDLRVLVRSEEAFRERHPTSRAEVIEGDLSEQDDVDRAIDDVDTVFHCAGMPYFDWGDLIGHTRRLIKAAEEEEQRVDIVFPGNVHVYGDVGPGTVSEDQPTNPPTRKGKIRVNIERRLKEANAREECRTTVARFPDLYGECVKSRCMERIFPSALRGKTVKWPGDLDAECEYIYVDDAAEAMVRLADSERAWGEAWHVPGPGVTTAREFITMAFEEAGRKPSVKAKGKGSLKVRGTVSNEALEEREIFYLFLRPPLLDCTKWTRAFGEAPGTLYRKGVKRTVQWWREQLDLGG